MRQNKKILIEFLFLFITILFFTESACAQIRDQEDPAKNFARRLQQKVLLSDEQTRKIESILSDYINSNDKSAQGSADKKIVALMDEKQKAKYEIVKADLWNEINKAAPSQR